MDLVNPNVVKTRADFVGVKGVSKDVASAIARDVEYRLLRIIQNAKKFRDHGYRPTLRTHDIDSAMRLANVLPIYGYSSSGPVVFEKTKDGTFFLKDRKATDDAIRDRPLPPVPVDPYFRVHWLAVDGRQPAIPENPALDTQGKPVQKADESKVEPSIKPVVKHALSKEQQMLFDKITAAVRTGTEAERDAVLESLRSDSGIQQLVPYFLEFIANEVSSNLRNLTLLTSLMHMAWAMIVSPYLNLDLYMQQMLPAVLTCIVHGKLCEDASEKHWDLRHFSASLLPHILRKLGRKYPNLKTRIQRTLLRPFLKKHDDVTLTSLYGATVGLMALGRHTTVSVLVPRLIDGGRARHLRAKHLEKPPLVPPLTDDIRTRVVGGNALESKENPFASIGGDPTNKKQQQPAHMTSTQRMEKMSKDEQTRALARRAIVLDHIVKVEEAQKCWSAFTDATLQYIRSNAPTSSSFSPPASSSRTWRHGASECTPSVRWSSSRAVPRLNRGKCWPKGKPKFMSSTDSESSDSKMTDDESLSNSNSSGSSLRNGTSALSSSSSRKRSRSSASSKAKGSKRNRPVPSSKPRFEPKMVKVLYGRKSNRKEKWAPVCETKEQAKHAVSDLKYSSKPRLWKASELFHEPILAQIPTPHFADTFL